MKERIVRGIVNVVFVLRYWVIFPALFGLILFTYNEAHRPGVTTKDWVSVFTGGAVVITLIYAFINYEYTQRRFKHDVKSSRDQLSFDTAMEWQREYMVRNSDILRAFYLKHEKLLADGKFRKIMKILEKPENDQSYTSLLVVLNYLESVALCVERGMMDEGFIKGFLASSFKLYYTRFIGFIRYRRTIQQNPKIWEHFAFSRKNG